MTEQTTEHLKNRNVWMRAVYMLLFAFAYGVAEFIVVLVSIFQLVAVLFTGSANEPLLRFGQNLSTYVWQILAFETFNCEVLPFPFTDWPDESVEEDNRWLSEDESEQGYEAAARDTDTAAEVAPEASKGQTVPDEQAEAGSRVDRDADEERD
ncbi:MAG: DUF4389 domain-containing protein [Pseudomonadales bacterium]|jgi:hypothetical protein|nr:DUF4389 domain-containing protein [Pseudomonadales bacterium]MDP6471277.1 DUF4389 domain-containing protein [Pseudomonadales bacterium]MDP6825534.1 DUF4389 domain-containing protein [Pseudomonadales bacterium]MDP6971576.1 DUF4389 domain-containing protein [Pseudomonadales bacterium]|tara:strand:- start:850 stop:1308 length:459 start_codon:yes stop_codon:yes gene_type:complete